MFCRLCGKEIGAAAWCPNCGAQQQLQQPPTQVIMVQEQPKSNSNVPALIGMILGIASFFSPFVTVVLSLIPAFGQFLCALVPFFPISGLILSIIGAVKAKKSQTGKGFAIAGIITNALCIILSIVVVILVFAAILILGATIVSMLGDLGITW